MSTKERILTIRLLEKAVKHPECLEKLRIEVGEDLRAAPESMAEHCIE